MQNDEIDVSSGSGLPDQEETVTETIEDSEDIENVGDNYVAETAQPSDVFIDYSGYFENLQTISILILGCLVAIGCILAWVGAKRE